MFQNVLLPRLFEFANSLSAFSQALAGRALAGVHVQPMSVLNYPVLRNQSWVSGKPQCEEEHELQTDCLFRRHSVERLPLSIHSRMFVCMFVS